MLFKIDGMEWTDAGIRYVYFPFREWRAFVCLLGVVVWGGFILTLPLPLSLTLIVPLTLILPLPLNIENSHHQ